MILAWDSPFNQQLTFGQPEQMAEERATGKRRKAMTVWMRQWLTRRPI